MRYASPLRYPGGKASLTGFLREVIDLNGLVGGPYFEPYAGGAGAALSLLAKRVVSQIWINDADERVFAFWHSPLNRTDQFVDRIFETPLTISEWRNQREICANPRKHRRFDVGFAAFYMNRCNRSGVLTGAGPIGGVEQKGKWRLDVRFSREPLAERILGVARDRNRIHLSNIDAIDFLKTCLPRGRARENVFVYLDPPYVNKAKRLYLNSFRRRDDARVCRTVRRIRHRCCRMELKP